MANLLAPGRVRIGKPAPGTAVAGFRKVRRLVFCLRNRVVIFRSATALDSRSDDEPMLFIARRSDDEDGAVPPEPGGPMEVPGRVSTTVPVRRNAMGRSY